MHTGAASAQSSKRFDFLALRSVAGVDLSSATAGSTFSAGAGAGRSGDEGATGDAAVDDMAVGARALALLLLVRLDSRVARALIELASSSERTGVGGTCSSAVMATLHVTGRLPTPLPLPLLLATLLTPSRGKAGAAPDVDAVCVTAVSRLGCCTSAMAMLRRTRGLRCAKEAFRIGVGGCAQARAKNGRE